VLARRQLGRDDRAPAGPVRDTSVLTREDRETGKPEGLNGREVGMLDIGWMELLVIGVVALLVVGPKELPALLRTIGRFIAMAKRQADEFRAQFDDAIRETEFEDIRREMNDIRHGRFKDPDKKASDQPEKVAGDAGVTAPAATRDTAVDFEGQGPIEPAPEFRDGDPTTSFTMADGTVVTKQDTPAKPDAAASQSEPATPRAAASDPADTTANKPTETTTDTPTEAQRRSNAEAIR